METDPKKLVGILRTEGKNAPKQLCFHLKTQLKARSRISLALEESFARQFVEDGGMVVLVSVASQVDTGNVQTYALVAVRVAITHGFASDEILKHDETLEQLADLLDSPMLPAVKQVVDILAALSTSSPSAWRRIHKAIKRQAKKKNKKPYSSVINCIVANDLDLQVFTLTLLNNLLISAPEKSRLFLGLWRELGAEDKLRTVAQTSKYDALIAQIKSYQKKLLAAVPETPQIIEDPTLQTVLASSSGIARARKGTITIAKKVAGVAGPKRRGEEDDSGPPPDSVNEVEKDDTHKDEAFEGAKESQKKKLEEKRKSKKKRENAAMENYQNTEIDEKLKAYEDQQPLIRLLKYELKRQEIAINEALAQGAHINAYAPLKRYVDRVDEMTVDMPVDLSALLTPGSLDEVKTMREKMESLAGQVEKLKEVGKALVRKKETEINALKDEITLLKEDDARKQRELDGFKRELQRKAEMEEYADERKKRESVMLEGNQRTRKDSPATASPLLSSTSDSHVDTKELEDMRSEIQRLKDQLSAAQTENEQFKQAEKQRVANADLLVKEMKAEAKTYESPMEMIDDFQKMKEQVIKLQLLKEQLVKEMRNIKKTAFVGLPYGDRLGGIDGLELKQMQEELERERKEKEGAQAEVLLLKTKISELGSPEEVEALRKQNAELTQTNQKVTKENTALRVTILEAKMKSKQDARQSPAKTKEEIELLETELARKDRELQEEKDGKEKALNQLKTMMKVMKVLKGKYDSEMETKKQMEAEMSQLRDRLEHRGVAAEEHETGTDSKKDKRSAKEIDEDLKTTKRRLKELEEDKTRWTKEKSDLEQLLEESRKNEYTSTNAALSLNDQVEKLEAELDQLRAERQDTALQDKVARLEKEKKDLQEQIGKELSALRGQTASPYEAEVQKLKEEVSRLQREKQMACQLLVSSNEKLKKMEALLDSFRKDAKASGSVPSK